MDSKTVHQTLEPCGEHAEPVIDLSNLYDFVFQQGHLCVHPRRSVHIKEEHAPVLAVTADLSPWRSLTKLDVSLNALKSLPTEVAGLASLRILFSLGNQFEEVPPVLRGLPSLYMLSFKSNKLARIGEEALAPTVAWLILTDNRLTSLPRSIGQCTNLRKCMLTDSRLNHS